MWFVVDHFDFNRKWACFDWIDCFCDYLSEKSKIEENISAILGAPKCEGSNSTTNRRNSNQVVDERSGMNALYEDTGKSDFNPIYESTVGSSWNLSLRDQGTYHTCNVGIVPRGSSEISPNPKNSKKSPSPIKLELCHQGTQCHDDLAGSFPRFPSHP